MSTGQTIDTAAKWRAYPCHCFPHVYAMERRGEQVDSFANYTGDRLSSPLSVPVDATLAAVDWDNCPLRRALLLTHILTVRLGGNEYQHRSAGR